MKSPQQCLLDFANDAAVDGELKRIGEIVGVKRGRLDSTRNFSHRIAFALQEEICTRELEIADREALLAIVLSLGNSPSKPASEQPHQTYSTTNAATSRKDQQ